MSPPASARWRTLRIAESMETLTLERVLRSRGPAMFTPSGRPIVHGGWCLPTKPIPAAMDDLYVCRE